GPDPARHPPPRPAADLGLVVPDSRNDAAFVADTTPRSARFLGPGRGQPTGPVARVTVAVCDWPFASTQPTDTLSPGCWASSSVVSVVAESTALAINDWITSPRASPADSAGEPDTTPDTGAPPMPWA